MEIFLSYTYTFTSYHITMADEYDDVYDSFENDDVSDVEEADYGDEDDFQIESDDEIKVDNDVYLDMQPEWRGNEAGKSRVGIGVIQGGVEDLSTVIGGQSNLAKRQQKLHHRDQNTPDVIFKTAIYTIQNEYDLPENVKTTVETLISKIPHIELRNPLAMMLAVFIMRYDSDEGTVIDLEKLKSLRKKSHSFLENELITVRPSSVTDDRREAEEIEERINPHVKVSILEKAKITKNVTEFDILRYARFLLPYLNNKQN